VATIPPGVGIVEYLQFDGNPPAAFVSVPSAPSIRPTLCQLRDEYVAANKESLEANTLATARMHFRYLIRHLGSGYPIGELSLADLQGYVNYRSGCKWRQRTISAETIRKELKTLRTAWNWAEIFLTRTSRF
jgi:hypothetical protein